MLQNLRSRKLQLDRTILDLEAYAAICGLSVPAEKPRRANLVPPPGDSHEQWLQ